MNDIDVKEKQLREKIIEEPDNTKAWIDLGYILTEKGNYIEAEQVFKRVLEFSSNNKFALYELGYLYYLIKKLNDAEVCFLKLVENDPNNLNAWFNLGLIFEENKNPLKALEAYEKVITLDSNEISAWRNASKLYFELNRFDEAEKACLAILKINPSDVTAALNLAMLLELKKKNLSSALEVYMECFQQNPFCTILLKNIYRITGNNRYIPSIVSAAQIKDYQLKNHHLTLIGDINSKGQITYKYILLLYENGNIEPIYYVSLEDNTLYNTFGGPVYFLCAFADKGHVNYGGVDNSSQEHFIKQAFNIIASNFNDIKEELSKISR